MILLPWNSDVTDLKTQILDMMPGEAESLLSINSMVDEARANDGISRLNIPPEFLHTLDPSDLPPSDLKMKLGSLLILLWNLCPARGLCNGIQMILL